MGYRQDNFNDLSNAETERIALLMEEAAEVIQACGKILRHGYASHNPDKPKSGSNREQLERELGDLRLAVRLMVNANDVDGDAIVERVAVKAKKVVKYLHHQ